MIIILLLLLIIIYCIFAYPYIFNKIDMIHYKIKIAKKVSLIEFDEDDIKQVKIAKLLILNYINNLFSNIINLIKYIININNDIKCFINSIIYDFII